MRQPLNVQCSYPLGLTSQFYRRHARIEFGGPDARQQMLVEQQPHTAVQTHRKVAGSGLEIGVVTAGRRAVNLALALWTLRTTVSRAHRYTMMRIIAAHRRMLGGMACSSPTKNFK